MKLGLKTYRRSVSSVWRRRQRRRQGFTLTELMVASLLTTVVVLIAWTGLLSAINMSNESQAVTARKIELTRALDILTQEIREAQSINQSGDIQSDGALVTLTDVVAGSGLRLNEIGNIGDIALYLEIPTNPNISVCNTDAGVIPADAVDRVVYDVRQSPVSWLPPEVLARYGRIPEADGSINPCSKPIANDIVADSIAQTNERPACPGVLTGGNGFHVCQQNDKLDLLFKSSIHQLEDIPMQSSVTPRTVNFTPVTGPNSADSDRSDLVLTVTKNLIPGYINLSWRWSGAGDPPDVTQYSFRSLVSHDPNSPHATWSNTSMSSHQTRISNYSIGLLSSLGDTLCFRIDARLDDASQISSNQVCYNRTWFW